MWNEFSVEFPGAEKWVYQVQLWTEKIKASLIDAVTKFDGHDADYIKCAIMAEFYRMILLGMSKVTTIEGLKSDHIVENEIRGISVNSHSKEWNSLLEIITRNELDKINRDTVIQYYNLIQGEGRAQVFLDRVSFDAMVRTVKNERLFVDKDILEINDPVRLRRDAREYLKTILEKLDRVREGELKKASDMMMVIQKCFGETNIDDEDIEDMVEKIIEFYDVAQDGKMPPKYDQGLFDDVKKHSRSISQAIRDIINAQKTTTAIDCILTFSQDPIRKLEKLVLLLDKVVEDIKKVQQEVELRREKYGNSNTSGTGNVFEKERTIIKECKDSIDRLEGMVCS